MDIEDIVGKSFLEKCLSKKNYKTEEEKEIFLDGCRFALNHVGIEDIWAEMSYFEKEDWIFNEQYDVAVQTDCDIREYVDIYDAYDSNENEDEKLSFLIEKLRTYYPHEIARKLKTKDKEIFNEINKEIS